MLKKITKPVLSKDKKTVVGTDVTYRLFGVLICRKVLVYPSIYGLKEWEYFTKF